MVDRVLPLLRRYLSRQFVHDVLTLQAGQAVATVTAALALVVYTRVLGLEEYGRYAVVLGFTAMAGLFTNLGQKTTTLTFLAEAQAAGNSQRLRLVLQYYVLTSVVTSLALLVAIPLLPLLADWIYGRPEIGRAAALVFAASAVDPIFNFLCILLQSARKIRMLSVLENGQIVFQFLVAAGLILLVLRMEGILLASLAGSIVFSGIAAVLLPRLAREHGLPPLRSLLSAPDWWHMRRHLRDGLLIAFDKNVGNMTQNTFFFLLTTQVNDRVAALVKVGMRLGSLPATFVLTAVTRLATSVLPAMSVNAASFRRNVYKLMRHTVAWNALAGVGTVILAPVAITILYGPAFAPAIFPCFVTVLFYTIMSFYSFTTPILRLSSEVYWATLCNGAGVLTGLLLWWLTLDALGPTKAMYVSLLCCNLVACTVVLPTARLLRRMAP